MRAEGTRSGVYEAPEAKPAHWADLALEAERFEAAAWRLYEESGDRRMHRVAQSVARIRAAAQMHAEGTDGDV